MDRIFSIGISKRLAGGLGALVFSSLAMLFSTPGYAANCAFNSTDTKTQKLSFTVPADLQVPRNAPAGTVIWESADVSAGSTGPFNCATDFTWGTFNSVGASASASSKTDLPIGETGLAWSLVYFGQGQDVADISLARTQAWGTYSFGGASFKLRIKKIGSVTAGASIAAGLLGLVSVNKEFNAFTVNVSNQASVSTVSCKTPDVTVRMGDKNRVGQFKGVGTSLAPVSFSIGIKECPDGINKVSYLLKPNTEIVDSARSVIALDAASSAKGVGLQLLDESANPVALNKTIVFNGYDKAGGDFNIPLKAAYHQTVAVIEPGTANSSVTFVMSYE
jgi:type 1 fimbria pilin